MIPDKLRYYPMTIYTLEGKKRLPDSKGLYYVVDAARNELLYIGMSVNIKNRFKSKHCNVGHLYGNPCIGIITTPYEDVTLSDLHKIERCEIAEYKPPINRRY